MSLLDLPEPPILEQGGRLQLHEHHPDLVHLQLGLGWEEDPAQTVPFDLDISAFLLTSDDRVRHDLDFIFYNNRKSLCGSVRHMGDEKRGALEGDDETIAIDLSQVPETVLKIVLCASLHKAEERRQTLSQVKGAYIRLHNMEKDAEITRVNLRAIKGQSATAVIFGELRREDEKKDWQFCLVGQEDEGGLPALARDFGVNI